MSEELWRQVRSLRGTPTQQGLKTASLYVFYDPNCPFSAKLWQASFSGNPFADVPAIWIPVAYLTDTSLGKAAALLRFGSKANLSRNFTAFPAANAGAIAPVTPLDAERLALGRAKTAWNQLGQGTPALVFRSNNGQVKVVLGFDPKSLEAIVGLVAPLRLER